jgi:hypothetical protein
LTDAVVTLASANSFAARFAVCCAAKGWAIAVALEEPALVVAFSETVQRLSLTIGRRLQTRRDTHDDVAVAIAAARSSICSCAGWRVVMLIRDHGRLAPSQIGVPPGLDR